MSEIASKIKSIRWQHVMFFMLMTLLVAGADSCKSTGKMSKKERKAQIENAKKQLQPIISGTSTLSYEEQKRIVGDVMGMNLNDPIVNDMIVQAQQKLKTLLMEQTQAKAQKVDGARAQLYDLLLNKDNKSADELEREMNAIKKLNLGDPEIDELLGRLEKKIQDMRSGGSNLPVKTQLENAFTTIANSAKSGNLTNADNTIMSPSKTSDATVIPIQYTTAGGRSVGMR